MTIRWAADLNTRALTQFGIVIVVALYVAIGAVIALVCGVSPARIGTVLLQLALLSLPVGLAVALVRDVRRRRRDARTERALVIEIRRALR